MIEPIVIANIPRTNNMFNTLELKTTSGPNTLYIILISKIIYALRTRPDKTAEDPDVEVPCASGSQEWNG